MLLAWVSNPATETDANVPGPAPGAKKSPAGVLAPDKALPTKADTDNAQPATLLSQLLTVVPSVD